MKQTGHSYFCRGCGKPLRAGGKETFHAQCLREDKVWRTRESRRIQRMQFDQWLTHVTCPHCKLEFGAPVQTGRKTGAKANRRQIQRDGYVRRRKRFG